MLSLIIRFFIPALIILIVSELARRSPRLGALLLTLPLISILAFGAAWLKDHDLKNVSRLARETLILVPLGLPFFLPLAFAEKLALAILGSDDYRLPVCIHQHRDLARLRTRVRCFVS